MSGGLLRSRPLIVSAVRMNEGSKSGPGMGTGGLSTGKKLSGAKDEASEITEGILGFDVLCDIPPANSSAEEEAMVLADGRVCIVGPGNIPPIAAKRFCKNRSSSGD